LNKRLRSRVLAASIVSTTLVGAGIPLIPLQSAHAQDRPSAEAQLNRGQALYDQKNYSEAKRILTDIEELATIARHVAENRLGEIRLVATSQLSTTLFPRAIGEFQKKYPDVFVSLEIIPLRDADRWISGLNFDLGVSALPMAWSGLSYEPFLTLAPVAVVPTGNPLASRASLSARDLDGQPFIRLTNANLLRAQVDADLIKSNAHPIVRAEVSTPMTACALAAQGVGLAVVDAYSPVVAKTDGFQIVPWKSSGVLTYGFFYPRDTVNPFVPAFKKILRRLAIADQPRTGRSKRHTPTM